MFWFAVRVCAPRPLLLPAAPEIPEIKWGNASARARCDNNKDEPNRMATRKADAVWQGGLQDGQGTMKLGSGAYEGAYSFRSRFADGAGTNPEELIAAAHAGCFSMALSATLGAAGFTPTRIHTTAAVDLMKEGEGFAISRIVLSTEATVPNVTPEAFAEMADSAKKNCPVSKALAGVGEITLNARLVS